MNDRRVASYIEQQETAAQRSIEMLPTLKEQFHREQLHQLFDFSDLQRSENQLARVLEEHFSRSYPRLVAAHRQARTDINDKVVEVSRKWIAVFMALNGDQLHAPEFCERVTRSATYFLNTVTDVLGNLLGSTVAESDSAMVKKRFNDAVADINMVYDIKVAILKEIAVQGFDASTFMRLKQRVTLAVVDGKEQKPEKRKRRNKKEAEKADVNVNDIENEELFERLRKWRIHKSLQKKMPVYTILQQKALIGIANSKPTTIKELLAIPYIGKKTAEEYGEEILSLVENTKS
jgi:superfamily II DNA helicase RecQ